MTYNNIVRIKMNKYRNGVIYRIKCRDPNVREVYIGSSTDFEQRRRSHKSHTMNINCREFWYDLYFFIRENGGWDNFEMELLEQYPCDCRRELNTREQYYLEQYDRDYVLNSNEAKRVC